MKIVVTGTGYVGLVTGVCLAELGHTVHCLDTNEEKIKMLNNGLSPVFEPGIDELIKENSEQKRLNFTSNYVEAYRDADVIFIAVETPELPNGSADLNILFKAAEQIAENIQGNCLIVIKSTVPIGTADKLNSFIEDKLRYNVTFEIASNPEFLSQGTAINDTLYAKRLILGVESDKAEGTLREIYKKIKSPILVTNRRSAEMIKYASNDFLALKISFVNDIANLCEIVGADIDDVTKGMSFDDRIGNKFLNAGIGYGGSCFPKDTKSLHWLAYQHGYELRTVKAAIEVNELQKTKLISKARKQFPSFKGIRVSILGVTFKPGTDDLREAPSIDNIKILVEEGALLTVFDPVGMEKFKNYFPQVNYATSVEESLRDAEACFIFTEWDMFKEIKPEKFLSLMSQANVYDGRNCFSVLDMRRNGVNYISIGR
ncbi:UDP-glucose dehydrogenase family protein [Paenibacillus terreus]|uniref:UDP-glucose 6-dehydrogenase n=1 Tax=Paenibacillus terreus TaxID=1387834 RepID=A0ABV5BF95_9BACL